VGRASLWPVATLLLALGCGGRAGGGEEDYYREPDPGLREEHYWALAGQGACEGEGSLVAGAGRPDDERCDARRLGTLAVCWDGAALAHPAAPGEARCLYGGGPLSSCREGPGSGRIWECVRTDAE
jgi:hypothetical protein